MTAQATIRMIRQGVMPYPRGEYSASVADYRWDDDRRDIVRYDGVWYAVKKYAPGTPVPKAQYPSSSSAYWTVTSQFEIVVTSMMLADAIRANALTVGDKFQVGTDGRVEMVDAVIRGVMYNPYKEIALNMTTILDIREFRNFKVVTAGGIAAGLRLPSSVSYDGASLRILSVSPGLSFVLIRSAPLDSIANQFIYDGMDTSTRLSGIFVSPGSEVRLMATRRTGYDFVDWVVENYNGVTIGGIGTLYDCWPAAPKETGWYKKLNG